MNSSRERRSGDGRASVKHRVRKRRCKWGHLLDLPGAVSVDRRGHRSCRACRRDQMREWMRQKHGHRPKTRPEAD